MAAADDIEKVAQAIANTEGEIKNVEKIIEDVEEQIKTESDPNEKKALREEKKALREKEKALYEKEKALREKELLLLKQRTDNAAGGGAGVAGSVAQLTAQFGERLGLSEDPHGCVTPSRPGAPTSTGPSPDKVKFTVNGAIGRNQRQNFFFVDPSDANAATLLPLVRHGHYVMLHGPRASGKSTRMLRACDQLGTESFCMNISLETGVDFSDVTKFWTTFGGKFVLKYPQLPSITNANDFVLWFDNRKRTKHFNNKDAVVFIDEFDMLYSAGDEVRDSVLHTLRGLKQERISQDTAHCLQSVIAVGPFSILKLTGRSGSPFNATDAVLCPSFAVDDVRALFQAFSVARGFLSFSSEIADDVFQRTSGHAGLVSFCGKAIDEELCHGGAPTYETWLRFARERLLREVSGWITMGKLVNTLARKEEAVVAARKLLCERVLPAGRAIVIDVGQQEADFLVAEGALVQREGKYAVPSSLVKELLLRYVVPVGLRPVPKLPPPFAHDGSLDVFALLRGAVSAFDPTTITRAYREAYKTAGGVRARGQLVPHEACYHFELLAVMRAWLPRDVTIDVEAKGGLDGQRCDLVVGSAGRKYVLELQATASGAEIEEHYGRAADYARMLGATEAWVIHFVATDWREFPLPAAALDVRAVHVCHNRDFTTVEFLVPDDAGSSWCAA